MYMVRRIRDSIIIW